jgi:tRNA (cytidine/uridine-2'-O-)-methyltransferase
VTGDRPGWHAAAHGHFAGTPETNHYSRITNHPLRAALMFDVVLYQPEIPPNTGNAIRLCANTGARLHLVGPLGFAMDDKQLRRAGLDYHEYATVQVHADLDAALAHLRDANGDALRVFALSTRGRVRFDTPAYRAGDVFLFGPETRGLPGNMLDALPALQRLRLPMQPKVRSLNLSNAVAVVVFEAWRQLGYAGADDPVD